METFYVVSRSTVLSYASHKKISLGVRSLKIRRSLFRERSRIPRSLSESATAENAVVEYRYETAALGGKFESPRKFLTVMYDLLVIEMILH